MPVGQGGGCREKQYKQPWRALKQSQDRAASELFAALYPSLAGWCRRLVDDDGTAHDIASEAFTRLWARWTTVEEPRGFLYVTAANLVRDHWRKLERERRAMRHATTQAALDAGRQADSADTTVPVRLLVQSLPARLRTTVLLYYYADLPIREVSLLMGRKEGTVKADLHAARNSPQCLPTTRSHPVAHQDRRHPRAQRHCRDLRHWQSGFPDPVALVGVIVFSSGTPWTRMSVSSIYAGSTLWFRWKMFCGSYCRFTARRRS